MQDLMGGTLSWIHNLRLWGTIIGYMLLALTISTCTSLWIRYHLKRKDLHPRRALKKIFNCKKAEKVLTENAEAIRIRTTSA